MPKHTLEITFENGNVANIVIDDGVDDPKVSITGLNYIYGISYVKYED